MVVHASPNRMHRSSLRRLTWRQHCDQTAGKRIGYPTQGCRLRWAAECCRWPRTVWLRAVWLRTVESRLLSSLKCESMSRAGAGDRRRPRPHTLARGQQHATTSGLLGALAGVADYASKSRKLSCPSELGLGARVQHRGGHPKPPEAPGARAHQGIDGDDARPAAEPKRSSTASRGARSSRLLRLGFLPGPALSGRDGGAQVMATPKQAFVTRWRDFGGAAGLAMVWPQNRLAERDFFANLSTAVRLPSATSDRMRARRLSMLARLAQLSGRPPGPTTGQGCEERDGHTATTGRLWFPGETDPRRSGANLVPRCSKACHWSQHGLFAFDRFAESLAGGPRLRRFACPGCLRRGSSARQSRLGYGHVRGAARRRCRA